MNDKWRWIRLLLLLAVFGGLGYVGYRWFFGPSVEGTLQKGTDAYQAGAAALEKGDAKTAVLRLEEADLLTRKGLSDLEAELKATEAPDAKVVARHQRLEAELCWVRARALRDLAYARAAEAGKPLVIFDDSSTGEKFRHYLANPDAKSRGESTYCLRVAASRLPGPDQIFLDALRVELTLPAANWVLVGDMADKLLAKDPKDVRSNYLKARIEYDQPRADKNFTPTPEDKRVRSRVLKGLEYLKEVEKADDYPLWRTLHLKAKIHAWLADHHGRNDKVEEQRKEEKIVKSLLAEIPGLVERGEGFKLMASYDVDGILDLHLMAIRQAIEDTRRNKDGLAQVRQALDGAIELCTTGNKKSPALSQKRLAETAVEALAIAQTALGTTRGAEWDARVGKVRALVDGALKDGAGGPLLATRYGELLAREAILEAQKGSAEQARALTGELTKWIDRTAAAIDPKKNTLAEMAQFHLLAAQHKFTQRAKRSEIEPHLKFLADTKDPRLLANVLLFEGALEEREGRLGKAREHLEKVITGAFPDLALRGHMAAVGIYLSQGEPILALRSLRELDNVYRKFEELPDLDRQWAMQFLRTPQQLDYVHFIANLEAAKEKARDFLARNPGKPVPYTLVENNEKQAERLFKELPLPPSPLNREARLARMAYLATTSRVEQAKKELDSLKKDFPDSVGVLQADIAWVRREYAEKTPPAKGEIDPLLVAEVDGLIKSFLAANPGSTPGRLFWGAWLVQSKRADQAVAYLENPANFPKGTDAAHQRLLAAALLGKGEREEARKILQHIDDDPNTFALTVQLAASVEERKKQLGEALSRFENAGLFRCWNASLAMQERKYEDAFRQYLQALDFTRVVPLARRGMRSALLTLALQEPAAARKAALEGLAAHPKERDLLLGFALASVLLDEVGNPEDQWESKKNMASALNRWEVLGKEQKEDAAALLLTKAELWNMAGREDRARVLAQRAAATEPENARPLRLLVALGLDIPTEEYLADVEKHLETLAKLEPKAVEVRIWRANVAELRGKYPEAVVLLENCLADHPKDNPVHRALFRVLGKAKDQKRRRTLAQQWLKVQPDNLEAAQACIEVAAEEKNLEEARKIADDFVARQLEATRKKLAESKDAEKDPKNPKIAAALKDYEQDLRLNLARGLQRAKAYDEAARWVAPLLADRKDHAGALLFQGEILVAQEKWKEAAAHYQAMVEKVPNHFIAGNNLAWILATKLDRIDEGLKLAESLALNRFTKEPLGGDRLHPGFLDTLGVIYTKLASREGFDKMRKLFEPAVRHYAADPRMALYLGHAFRGLNEKAKAEAMYTRAISLARSPCPTLDSDRAAEVAGQAEAALKKLQSEPAS